jgi:YD repeat-containing protein
VFRSSPVARQCLCRSLRAGSRRPNPKTSCRTPTPRAHWDKLKRRRVHSYSQTQALGQPLSVTVSGPDAFGATTSTITHYRYDLRGSRTAVIDALGNETDFAYNLADQLTTVTYPATNNSGTGRTQTITAYQYLGGPASGTVVNDENNTLFRQVAYTYGPEGELLTTTGNAYPVLYSYDGRGRVNHVTYYHNTAYSVMDGSTTSYDYDPEGRLADVRYPNQSGATFDKLQYFYDADGNMIQEIDGVGVTKTYTRTDPESLLTAINYAYPTGYSGTPIGTLNAVTFSYDHWGRRINSADSATTKIYTYDDLDELTSLNTDFGANNDFGESGPLGLQINYLHNQDGSRRVMSLANCNPGLSQVYQYDGVGRLTATYLPGSPVYGNRYSYFQNGWLARMQSAYASSNWNVAAPYLQVDRTYNSRGFLTGLANSQIADPSHPTQLTPLSSFVGATSVGMTYDPNGNRLTEVASVPARGQAPDLSRAVQYHYDALDQLTQEISTSGGGTTATSYTNTFGYDLSGNPMTSSRLNGRSFNADNQSTQSLLPNGMAANITYNGNGDPFALLFLSTTYSTQFDPEDRLTKTVQGNLDARYDGDGLRAWDMGIYYLYDGDQLVAEVDGQSNLLALNVFGAGGQELRWRGDDTLSPATAYTYDPQGNLVQPVTLYVPGQPPFLKVSVSAFFDGFGGHHAETADSGDSFDPVGFGGEYGYYLDPATGLYELTHRYYDPKGGPDRDAGLKNGKTNQVFPHLVCFLLPTVFAEPLC